MSALTLLLLSCSDRAATPVDDTPADSGDTAPVEDTRDCGSAAGSLPDGLVEIGWDDGAPGAVVEGQEWSVYDILLSEAVLNARENVRQGEGLAGPLSESPVFPPMVTRMVGIGEKTGSLEVLLEKISEFYDDQVSATVKQLTSLIEPIMIAVMGIVVGTICLSVFLPIFELQKQLAAR